MKLKECLVKYFLRYVNIPSQSTSNAPMVPSTEGQRKLAAVLAEDLKALGAVDIEISDTSVVTAHIPARLSAGHVPVPTVGWVAHLDTVDVKLSEVIHPKMIRNYDGNDIVQNAEKNLTISVQEHPELKKYIGDDIIVSDGTSVLGADNKAAIANIMTVLELLHEDETIEHGTIYVAFVPDEEVGLRGSKSMDFTRFPVDFAYTIDCCEKGELVYETFNAGSAVLSIKGQTAHPMSSKNNVVNPALIAVDFVNLLDRAETPEHTENTEGFIWVTGISADVLNAKVTMSIRDHSKQKYEAKKAYLEKAVEMVRMKHPKAEISLQTEDVYANIADAVTDKNRKCIDYLFEGMKQLDITPKVMAMRGGTDGSFISTKGILVPNYFTGAHNFHASCEFLPLSGFEASCRLTLKLIELITKG